MSDDWREKIIKERLGGKTDWTDEERTELCKELDKEFDAKLKLSNKGGLSDDERWHEHDWKEKMAEHPFFAPYLGDKSTVDEETLANNPLYAGIAQLKYAPEHNTPAELAETYRQEGLDMFRKEDYENAWKYFKEGIEQHCEDDELNAKLHNNCAAAYFYLGKYRPCIEECKAALEKKPDYIKAINRLALCHLKLKEFERCIEWCDKGSEIDTQNKAVFFNLRRTATKEKKNWEMEQRKQKIDMAKSLKLQTDLRQAIESRSIDTGFKDDADEPMAYLQHLKPIYGHLQDHPVRIKSGQLSWPVVFLYPVHETGDGIQEFDENTRFDDHLCVMFHEDNPAPWDSEGIYVSSNLEIYFNDKRDNCKIKIDPTTTLLSVLKDSRFLVENGTPTFYVFPKNTDVEKYKIVPN